MEPRASCMRIKCTAIERHHHPSNHFIFGEENYVAGCITTKQHQEQQVQCVQNHLAASVGKVIPYHEPDSHPRVIGSLNQHPILLTFCLLF